YFFSAGVWPVPASSSRTTTPSTRARENPLTWSSRSSSAYSPLRPRTTGASTWNLMPSSSSSTRSTLCCGICLAIGRPQTEQRERGQVEPRVRAVVPARAAHNETISHSALLSGGFGRAQGDTSWSPGSLTQSVLAALGGGPRSPRAARTDFVRDPGYHDKIG